MSSKIPETTDKIKKKLSFNDVKPSYQHSGKPSNQRAAGVLIDPQVYNEQEVNQTHETACQQTGETAQQKNDYLFNHQANILDNQYNGISFHQSNFHSNNMTNHSSDESAMKLEGKKKATYYLTDKAAKQMDDMFIKSIAARKKKDKSALICEAIELLYQKEFNQ